MKTYVKGIDQKTKLCYVVGTGTNIEYYKKSGFILKQIQQSYNGEWYLSGYAPLKPISLIRSQLYDITYAKKSSIAYNCIYIIKDEIKYKFQTSQDSINMCNSTQIRLQSLPDDTQVNWKSWVDDQPTILVITKVQFNKIFNLGLTMVNQAFEVQGILNTEIANMTEEDLRDETKMNQFKQKVQTQFSKIQIEFQLNSI